MTAAIAAALLFCACPAAHAQDQALAAESESRSRFVIESADYMKYDRSTKLTTLRGLVRIRSEESFIQADEVTVNEADNTLAAFGRVVIEEGDNTIIGSALYFDNDNDYFELANPQGKTTAPDVDGTIYYTGRLAKGTSRKIKILNGSMSTCGPNCRKEYHVTAKDITIYPDNKIISRKAAFYMGAYRVMYLPVHVISLKDREQYMPEFGYSKEEGWFVKTKYPYYATAAVTGLALLDYMSDKGTAWGAEHDYYSGRFDGKGHNYFKTLNEKDTGRVSTTIDQWQEYKIGDKTSGRVSYGRTDTYNIYQDRSRINRTTLNATFNRDVRRIMAAAQPGAAPMSGAQKRRDSITYSLSEQDSTSKSRNSSLIVNQAYSFAKSSFNYNFQMTESSFSGNPTDEEGTLTTNYSKTAGIYTLSVKTSKNFDMDGDGYIADNSRSVNTILPEVTLALNSQFLNRLVPVKNEAARPRIGLNVTHGRYREGSRNDSYSIRRTAVESDISRTFKLSKNVSFTPTQRYKQFFYQTKDAKYALENNSSLNWKLDDFSSLNFNYTRRQDAGGAPFRKDSFGESNQLSGTYRIGKPRTQFSLSSGYNYEIGQYQPLNMGYTRGVTRNATLDLKTGFSLDSDLWQPTVTTLKLARKNLEMNLGATWDTERSMEMTTAQVTTRLTRNNGWQFDIRAAYQDPRNQPFIREWVATKTRCCTQVQLAYSAERDEIKLNYWILAFPGQRVGIYQGQDGLRLDDSAIPTQFGGQQ